MTQLQTQIKICGIKCPDIAYESVKLGADYIGLIFHKDSKRNIEFNIAKEVATTVKNAGATPVAVLVNQSADEMMKICRDFNINIVQLHGSMVREQHTQLPDDIVRIYVLNIGREGELIKQIGPSFEDLRPERDFLLFDGPCGGSGEKIMTNRLNEISGEFNFFIAGGLNETNVEEVISNCNPFAVDVSSGVENIEGNKDVRMVKKFISRVRRRSLIK